MIAPAGPVSLLREFFILFPLNDKRSFPNVPNAENVSTVCALISFAAIHIALKKGNLIGLRSSAPAKNVNHKIQLSAGQCSLVSIFLLFLSNTTAISLPIFFFKMLPIFHTSTGSLLIETTVSQEVNHIFCPRRLDDTLSIFAGVDTKSPLINHCVRRKFTVGIR